MEFKVGDEVLLVKENMTYRDATTSPGTVIGFDNNWVKVSGWGGGSYGENVSGWDSRSLKLVESVEPTKTVEPISDKEFILLEAIKATTKDRNNTYGPPSQDFTRTAALWSVLFEREFSAYEVALAMIALKMSRATWSPGVVDHWVDLAGYAGCGYECVTEEGIKNGNSTTDQ